jgi:hypothetical protein
MLNICELSFLTKKKKKEKKEYLRIATHFLA